MFGMRALAASAAMVALTTGTAWSAPSDAMQPLSSYRVVTMGPLAGSAAFGASITNRGLVAGTSTTVDGTTHAVLWNRGRARDLGTLGGRDANSAVLWPVKNNMGVVAGISQTDNVDPNNESWSCGAFLPARPGYTCVGFVWHDGRMSPLPTLGGPNGFATGVNNSGQVVGWAENEIVDPYCTGDQVLQFHAVLWDGFGARTTELTPLPTDSVSAATALNDNGRVVGISGICDQAVGRYSARNAVVWDRGIVHRLRDLGGLSWNTPMSVNEYGDIAGFLNRSAADGASLRPLPVWWSADGRLHKLDVPDDYAFGQALGINAHQQIVGVAYNDDFTQCTAMLWQNGQAVLLDSVRSGADVHLCSANDINDRGQITGKATDTATGLTVAFVATPT
jgi:probable HAF family extracellular repeat protein